MERIVELYSVTLPHRPAARSGLYVVREAVVIVLPEGEVGEGYLELVQTWSSGQDTVPLLSELKSPRIRELWERLQGVQPWLRVARW